MTDYKRMYLAMVSATEEAMAVLSRVPFPDAEIALRSEVITILAKGQQQAEDIYIDTCGEAE